MIAIESLKLTPLVGPNPEDLGFRFFVAIAAPNWYGYKGLDVCLTDNITIRSDNVTVNPEICDFGDFIRSRPKGIKMTRLLFHEKLRCAIDDSGIGVPEIADQVQVAPNTVYSWLKGKTSPTVAQAVILSKATSTPIAYLVDDCADPPSPIPAASPDRTLIERHIQKLGEERAQRLLAAAVEGIIAVAPAILPLGKPERRQGNDTASK